VENKQGMLVLPSTGEGADSMSDEEIDEEGAFDDNDEELYGDMFHTMSKRGTVVAADSDSEHDSATESDGMDEEDDDEANAGGMLLSDMLGSSNPTDVDEQPTKRIRRSEYESDEDSYGDEDGSSDDDDDDDDDEEEDDSEDEDDSTRRQRMLDVADKAAKSTKKLKRDAARAARDLEQTEAGQEGEFNATSKASNSTFSSSSALQLGTLVNSLKDTKAMGDLKKRVENMSRAEVVAAPTARIVEERAERAVGYEATKEEMGKWTQQVKATREARTVTFPLQQAGRIKPTTNSLAAGFEAQNDLESEIQAVLAASGLDDDKNAMKREQVRTCVCVVYCATKLFVWLWLRLQFIFSRKCGGLFRCFWVILAFARSACRRCSSYTRSDENLSRSMSCSCFALHPFQFDSEANWTKVTIMF
jgi:U3 small nucleolar RNA-associated protein 14